MAPRWMRVSAGAGVSRWITYRRTLHRLRLMRKERDCTMKKLAWRFGRGVLYVFLSGLAAKYTTFLAPEVSASLIGGALLAADKAMGVGALVSGAPAK